MTTGLEVPMGLGVPMGLVGSHADGGAYGVRGYLWGWGGTYRLGGGGGFGGLGVAMGLGGV